MPVDLDTHERVTKLQKDVEEIREELEDQWHEKEESYQNRVRKALDKNKNATVLYLEIDGVRSLTEIEKHLISQQKRIPTMSLWRVAKHLNRSGLIRKVGVKGKSPIFAKKPWAKALDIDDYVRTEIVSKE
jgi:hypothetical protein